jgi:hypothetical protein
MVDLGLLMWAKLVLQSASTLTARCAAIGKLCSTAQSTQSFAEILANQWLVSGALWTSRKLLKKWFSDGSTRHCRPDVRAGSAGMGLIRRSRIRSSRQASGAAGRDSLRIRSRIGKRRSAFPRPCDGRNAGR